MNHAVLYVRDIERSLAFYRDVLGFRPISMLPEGFDGAAFLQAPGSTNDHDLGLFAIGDQAGRVRRGSDDGRALPPGLGGRDAARPGRPGRASSPRAGDLVGASDHSTTKSLYAKDPDGIELEIAWIVPAALLDEAALSGRSSIQRLDLPAEIDRYGADTRGGVGISQPA